MGSKKNRKTKKSERKKMSEESRAALALYNKRGNSWKKETEVDEDNFYAERVLNCLVDQVSGGLDSFDQDEIVLGKRKFICENSSDEEDGFSDFEEGGESCDEEEEPANERYCNWIVDMVGLQKFLKSELVCKICKEGSIEFREVEASRQGLGTSFRIICHL